MGISVMQQVFIPSRPRFLTRQFADAKLKGETVQFCIFILPINGRHRARLSIPNRQLCIYDTFQFISVYSYMPSLLLFMYADDLTYMYVWLDGGTLSNRKIRVAVIYLQLGD